MSLTDYFEGKQFYSHAHQYIDCKFQNSLLMLLTASMKMIFVLVRFCLFNYKKSLSEKISLNTFCQMVGV